MTFLPQELKDIADIINSVIEETEFKDEVNIDPSDINPSTSTSGLIQFLNVDNPISKLFNQLTTNRVFDNGMFYHFKSFSRAIDIINNKSIQVSNLFSNSSNDFAEYSEFLKRLGLIHPFIPNNIILQRITKRFNPASKRPIDDDRNRILILCFVNNSHSERFWKEYADNDNGICLGFKFKPIIPVSDLFEFRDVCYDNGYKFDFFNKINFLLIRKYKRALLFNGLTKFAKFYKRGSYSWENETRLSFHYSKGFLGHYKTLTNIFPININKTTGRTYINLPLKGNTQNNPLFELTIDEVICGKNISANDYQTITQSTKLNFPHARIWKRK